MKLPYSQLISEETCACRSQCIVSVVQFLVSAIVLFLRGWMRVGGGGGGGGGRGEGGNRSPNPSSGPILQAEI